MMFQARSHTFELKNAGAVELHVGWTIDTEGKGRWPELSDCSRRACSIG